MSHNDTESDESEGYYSSGNDTDSESEESGTSEESADSSTYEQEKVVHPRSPYFYSKHKLTTQKPYSK